MKQSVWIILTLLSLVFCEEYKTLWDKDHQHPKFLMRPDQQSDWINPPGKRIKTDWYAHDKKRIENAMQQAQRMIELHKPAKNVVFFMGDGMGISTQTAGRIYLSQLRNLTGEDAQLSWESFPYAAFSKTYAVDEIVPDSANTATAMVCGEKTAYSIIGLNQDAIRGNCSSSKGNEVKSILHHSIDEGKWTGIVTTTRVTHASPAATYAHSAERDWESDADLTEEAKENNCSDIAAQLIDDPLNQKIRVILGGGREYFFPNTTADEEYPDENGSRLDERNLVQEWLQQKERDGLESHQYKYVNKLDDFNDIDEDTIQYIMGLFERGHTQYQLDKNEDPFGEPSLSEMVEKALKILKRSNKGYFLFVESGIIDGAHHANEPMYALSEVVEMSDAIEKVLELTDEEDTLLVVTADHSHVFTLGGYPLSDTDILGFDDSMVADDDKPYAILGYTNGPGFEVHRKGPDGVEIPRMNLTDLKKNMTEDKNFKFDAAIPRGSETHGGEDVGIFARGPMAHLFQGVQEQSYIGNLMMYASCVGKNKELCEMPQSLCAGPNAGNTLSPCLLFTLIQLFTLKFLLLLNM